jgi:hypothetical protein
VATDSTFVLGFCYPADLDVVEQLWASLAKQMASAAARRLRAGEHGPVAAVSWRLSFYEGYVAAVQSRLDEARQRTLQRPVEAGTTGELVLREMAERVRTFHDRESQARGTWRGGRGDRQVHRSAWRAGQKDGQNARLGAPEVEQRRQIG